MTKHNSDRRQPSHQKYRHSQIKNDLPCARRYTYHPKEISLVLQEHANRLDISQLSPTARHVLRTPISIPRSREGLHNLMQKWAPVFDEAFFFGQVGRGLRGGFATGLDVKTHLEGALAWYLYEERRIEVSTRFEPESMYVGSLVHEMLHAFLDIYGCQSSCCKKLTKPKWGTGCSGHGSAWANAMIKIQESLCRLVGYKIDCGLLISVTAEIQETHWRPRPEQLARWGLAGSGLNDLGGPHSQDRVWDDTSSDYGEELDYDDDEVDYGGQSVVCCNIM